MTRIAPINKGMPVLEGKTNFLSGQLLRWLKDVVNRLNSAVVTDANGNIAYGGATIPDSLSSDYLYAFTDSYAKWIHKTLGNEITGVGCYWDGSTHISLIIGSVSTMALTGTVFAVKGRVSTTVGQDLGSDIFSAPWVTIPQT